MLNLDVPLSIATGRERDLLLALAETYKGSDDRPCLDGDTTLRDWREWLVA